MRFDLVTLFPELFDSFVAGGLLGKAIGAGLVSVRRINPRDFAADRHRSVDDEPYGGGSGMVLMPGPIADALDHADVTAPGGRGRRVLLTPQGLPFDQACASRFSGLGALVLVCGRYEGIDERVRSLVDEEISIGDFVMFGGEVAAMAIMEAVARLIPGVLGNESSLAEESHSSGLLEYPQYTRPPVFRDMEVPAILRSGHHAAIERWRRKEALRRTREWRPDLLSRASLSEEDRTLLDELDRERDGVAGES